MIQPQYLYRAVNFVFENSRPPKEKFFIVFHRDGDSILLFSLATSQSKLPRDFDDTDGCVQFNDRGYGHAFIWREGHKIGTNGFAFRKRTYIQFEFKSQLFEVAEGEISTKATKEIHETCLLTDREYLRLLECVVRSRYLKKKHKASLIERIEKLKTE